jgi:hypothetical protein
MSESLFGEFGSVFYGERDFDHVKAILKTGKKKESG